MIKNITFLCVLTVLLSSCAKSPYPFKKTAYNQLDGFEKTLTDEDRQAIKTVCKKWQKTPRQPQMSLFSVEEWQNACSKLSICLKDNTKTLQVCLKSHFDVVEFSSKKPLFTGYFAPVYKGSLIKTKKFNTPLYNAPKDIVTASLKDFDKKYKNIKLIGRVQGKRFIPYAKREEIDTKGLPAKPIVWLSPVDAFFVHIQGSAFVELADKTVKHVAYAGNNGHPYFAIGRSLYKEGYLSKEEISMQNIRKWLENASESDMKRILHTNDRYIFFTEGNHEVYGSLGVELEEEKALAVDPKHIPLGAPLWVETTETLSGKPFSQFMVAADTGAAIEGAVRGDIYFGIGEKAGEKAGKQNASGKLFMFVPRK